MPNQFAGMVAEVEALEFSERIHQQAACILTQTRNNWQVYFHTNRIIIILLGTSDFPMLRIPLAMGAN